MVALEAAEVEPTWGEAEVAEEWLSDEEEEADLLLSDEAEVAEDSLLWDVEAVVLLLPEEVEVEGAVGVTEADGAIEADGADTIDGYTEDLAGVGLAGEADGDGDDQVGGEADTGDVAGGSVLL